MNDISGGDENLILARMAERMAGEGDGEERYLASIDKFLKLRSGAGGKTSGRAFSDVVIDRLSKRGIWEVS